MVDGEDDPIMQERLKERQALEDRAWNAKGDLMRCAIVAFAGALVGFAVGQHGYASGVGWAPVFFGVVIFVIAVRPITAIETILAARRARFLGETPANPR